MSKITPKNLSYDSTLPPFLQALRAAQENGDGRHERAIARPRRDRDAQEVEEEAPVVVDERGEVVEGVGLQGEAGEDEGGPGKEVKVAIGGEEEKDAGRRQEVKVAIGGGRKRKGRVVGGDGEDEGADRSYAASVRSGGALAEAIAADEKRAGRLVDASGTKHAGKGESAGKKKKAKKIKLSFDEE